MRLCIVEDMAVSNLEPLTLTRPAFELLLGATSLGQKIATAFGITVGPGRRGCVIRKHLVAVQQQRQPHLAVNDRDWLARGPVVVINSRWVPPVDFQPPATDGPSVGLCGGQAAFATVGPKEAVTLEPHGIDNWFDAMLSRHGGHEVKGEWINPLGPGRQERRASGEGFSCIGTALPEPGPTSEPGARGSRRPPSDPRDSTG